MPKLDKVADKADSKSTKKQEKQEEVQEQDTKEDTKEDTKKVMNRDTTKVGLNFNVKKFKDFMKTHFSQVHDTENTKVMNAHYMLAAVNEVTLFNLVTGVSHLFNKEKNGLQDLTLERLQNYVSSTDYLRESFSRFLHKYDSQLDYSKQLYVEKAKFDNYMMTHCLHSNNTVHVNKDTRNYLCFLLVQLNSHLSTTAFTIARNLSKKSVSTVNAQQMRASVDIMLTGKLRDDVNKKLDEITTILKNKPKQDSDKGDDSKSTKQKSKSKSKDDEGDEDDEEEDDDDDDDDEDEEEEEEDEEEEEEEEEKPKPKAKPAPAAKGKGSSK